jgi:hypothetical protein
MSIKIYDKAKIFGKTKVVTSSTPSADPYFGQTTLLIKADDGITDLSSYNNTINIVGNASVSTTVKKYGTGSIAFDGIGDEAYVTPSNNFAFRTGDFTIECWAYFTSSLNAQCLLDFRSSSFSSNGFFWGISANGRMIVYSGTTAVLNAESGVSLNSWNHFALVRTGTTMSGYVNGVAVQSVTSDKDWTDIDLSLIHI